MTERVLAEFGRIDILVNNAGGVSGRREPMLDMSDTVWDSVIDLNLRSTFLCSKLVGRVMRDQKKGNIINIASCSGIYPYPSMPPYGAAKAGVINLTKSLAVYLAPYNIRVNGIAPGAISTKTSTSEERDETRAKRYAIPLSRIGYPQDIAFAAIYLASDASDYVTGIVIEVAGGPMLGELFLRQAEENWNVDGKK
jgi:NAD(P)-dependent dehydrogenase (short-subunit alcohol dehydrogenase family)